ncbi:hypothetical protein MUY14_10760 [Amycolatopsis sp. FBCC-B4732]|nr:hypothetical protein [Amycolatopsis sp. FBCC-B4732]UOX91069.1 hypothetical protein MUY14_10760 [Amycolatopsis sp. FBCC-B4732]
MAACGYAREKKTTKLRVAAAISPFVIALTLVEQVVNLINQLKDLW